MPQCGCVWRMAEPSDPLHEWQHLPGEEVWLIGERRISGEHKYYLSCLPDTADLKTLASTIKARWSWEQVHQQLKEELGLDHFEGRSWESLHQAKRKKHRAARRPRQACQPFAWNSSVTCSSSGRKTCARSAPTAPFNRPNGHLPKSC